MKGKLLSIHHSSFIVHHLFYRVASERVGEDDDAGEHVGNLDLVRAGEHVFGLEAVERFVEVVVGVDDRAFEFESGEETFAARVGENPRVEPDVGGGAGRAPHGAGGGARLAADFKFVSEQTLQSVFVHELEYEVGLGRADLQADARAAHVEEGGR